MNNIRPNSSAAVSFRSDGLMDVIRGVRPNGASPYNSAVLPTELYLSDGIAQVIVDRPAEDALSRGFKIDGDEDETILNEMDRLNASIHITDAIRWARLSGASAILVLCKDGGTLNDPLNYDNIEIIEDLIVYDSDCISAEQMYYNDATKRNYGLPTHYRLQPMFGQPFTVHESRLIKFGGDPLPQVRTRMRPRLYWQGRSALDACANDLYRYRAGLRLAKAILERKQQAVHAMAGLSELLQTDEGKDVVRQKIALTDSVRGIMNGITIDNGPGNDTGTGDTYTIIDLSLGGIDTVIGEFRDSLAGSSRMPQTILFGSDIKGLGSTGTGEQGIYHSLVVSIQSRNLRPGMEEFARMIWAQRAVSAKEPEKWRLVFNPLFSPSEKEMSEVKEKEAGARKSNMEAVDLMVSSFLATGEEAREALKIVWPEIQFDASHVPELPDPNPDPTPANTGNSGIKQTGAI